VAAACSSWRSWHDLRVSPEHYPVMVDRALWLLTVILFSLIPALMYFQFDREKLRTLIDRWLHHLPAGPQHENGGRRRRQVRPPRRGIRHRVASRVRRAGGYIQ
jgi:hypothetical protein